MNKLLVDSSVWIDLLSKRPNPNFIRIVQEARKQHRLATCAVIQLEVTRGARTPKEFSELTEQFEALHRFEINSSHWKSANAMAFAVSKKGFQPPLTDLLIASVAIQNDAPLLHNDKDFTHIARFFPLKMEL